MRLTTQVRRLWVDAVCIDQQSIEERTVQIQYMRLIYKHATQVVVWLGLKTAGVEQAFDLAQRMAQCRDRELLSRGSRSPAEEASLKALMETLSNMSQPGAAYLSELFNREYFVRTWCVQEVIASTRCIGKCEELEMDFFDLISATPYAIALQGRHQAPSKTFQFWNFVFVARHPAMAPAMSRPVEGSLGPLLILLGGMKDFKATDPRDKVFALLGISDEGWSLS